MTNPLVLTFRLSRNILYLVSITLLCILVFQLMSIRNSAGHNDFSPLLRGDIARYLIRLAYYFPLELVSVGIILGVMSVYRKWLRLYSIVPDMRELLKYQLAYLPAILVGIFLLCPITNVLRYYILYAQDYGWEYYFPNYFFTWRMYFKYLIPVLLFSYGFLNTNLILDYMNWHRHQIEDVSAINSLAQTTPMQIEPPASEHNSTIEADKLDNIDSKNPRPQAITYIVVLDAFDQRGQTLLSVDKIRYFEVLGKVYQAHTIDRSYVIHIPFRKLIPQLDPQQFLRISRGIIINIDCVENYSYWEYDKFIVRLRDSTTEFIMQRSHLSALKILMANRK